MDDEKNKTIAERQAKEKTMLLDQLKKIPIVHVACEKSSVGRATYYRWRDEDDEFRKLADIALTEGEALVTDMSESQLITMIKERKFHAVHLWLRHHHPKYANKVEIVSHATEPEALTPEQKVTVEKALNRVKERNKRLKSEYSGAHTS